MSNRFTCCLVIGLLILMPAGASAGEWVNVKNKRCKFWSHTDVPRSMKFKWSGDCRGKMVNGYGTLEVTTGGRRSSYYRGYMKAGRANGRGLQVFESGSARGSRYEGDWVNGRRHGDGKYTWASGSWYEGGWANDKQSGQGSVWDAKSRDKYATLDGKRVGGEKKRVAAAPRKRTRSSSGGGILEGIANFIEENPVTSALIAAGGIAYLLSDSSDSGTSSNGSYGASGSTVGVGTLLLDTGSWCGEGYIRVKNLDTHRDKDLECCGWGNLGSKAYSLLTGQYELSYSIDGCGSSYYSGSDVKFYISNNETTLLRLKMDSGVYWVE